MTCLPADVHAHEMSYIAVVQLYIHNNSIVYVYTRTDIYMLHTHTYILYIL